MKYFPEVSLILSCISVRCAPEERVAVNNSLDKKNMNMLLLSLSQRRKSKQELKSDKEKLSDQFSNPLFSPMKPWHDI